MLFTLSVLKAELVIDMKSTPIRNLCCRITPMVKRNMIQANKKLCMYGKERPVLARFDLFGDSSSTENNEFSAIDGVNIVIVDPEIFGKFYLELLTTEEGSDFALKLMYK